MREGAFEQADGRGNHLDRDRVRTAKLRLQGPYSERCAAGSHGRARLDLIGDAACRAMVIHVQLRKGADLLPPIEITCVPTIVEPHHEFIHVEPLVRADVDEDDRVATDDLHAEHCALDRGERCLGLAIAAASKPDRRDARGLLQARDGGDDRAWLLRPGLRRRVDKEQSQEKE